MTGIKKIRHFLTEGISKLSTNISSYRRKRLVKRINKCIHNQNIYNKYHTTDGKRIGDFIIDRYFVVCMRYSFGLVFWVFKLGKMVFGDYLWFHGAVQKPNKKTRELFENTLGSELFREEFFPTKELEVYTRLRYGDEY